MMFSMFVIPSIPRVTVNAALLYLLVRYGINSVGVISKPPRYSSSIFTPVVTRVRGRTHVRAVRLTVFGFVINIRQASR